MYNVLRIQIQGIGRNKKEKEKFFFFRPTNSKVRMRSLADKYLARIKHKRKTPAVEKHFKFLEHHGHVSPRRKF